MTEAVPSTAGDDEERREENAPAHLSSSGTSILQSCGKRECDSTESAAPAAKAARPAQLLQTGQPLDPAASSTDAFNALPIAASSVPAVPVSSVPSSSQQMAMPIMLAPTTPGGVWTMVHPGVVMQWLHPRGTAPNEGGVPVLVVCRGCGLVRSDLEGRRWVHNHRTTNDKGGKGNKQFACNRVLCGCQKGQICPNKGRPHPVGMAAPPEGGAAAVAAPAEPPSVPVAAAPPAAQGEDESSSQPLQITAIPPSAQKLESL